MPEPIALLRFGRLDTPLDGLVEKFEESLIKVSFEGLVGYSLFDQGEKPYLFLVTQNLDKMLPSRKHNIILEIDSYSERQNNEIADRFERTIGTRLNMFVPKPAFQDAVSRAENFSFFMAHPEEYFKGVKKYQTGQY